MTDCEDLERTIAELRRELKTQTRKARELEAQLPSPTV